MDFTKVRPIQIVVTAVFAVLALVGLYFFATFSGFTGGREPVGSVVIWGTLPGRAVEQALNTLQASDRRFASVSYREQPAATFDDDLADAIASGRGPDLILISQEQLLVEEPRLEVLPFSSISERDYVDAFVPITELFLSESGMYGVPVAVDPLVLYYNRTLLANAGAARPPSTWEAVTGLASRMTERTEGGGIGRSAIALGEYGNVTNARGILSLLFLQAGSSVTSGTPSGIRSALKRAASAEYGGSSSESAVTFYTQFADPAKTVYSWNRAKGASRQAFLAGETALYLGYASELPQLQAANPNLDFDIAPAPSPATAQNRVTYGLAYAFAVPKASKNKAGAFEVATTIATGDAALDLAANAHMAPALRGALDEGGNDRYAEVYYPEALIARGWLSPAPSVVDEIFGTMIGNITSGRYDASGALDFADASLNEALQ